MEYHEVGERFEYDGVMLEVIQTPGCVSCFFLDNWTCKLEGEPMYCGVDTRNDKKCISYKLVEQCKQKENNNMDKKIIYYADLTPCDNMQDYKKHLAASLFADVLRKDRTDTVAIGTDKSEQEAQTNDSERKTTTQQQEDRTPENLKEEKNTSEQKGKNKDMVKDETKTAAAATLTPLLKQFYDLKAKHPDAILLFRCGDFYETYSEDAEKASKILGITLTRSSRTKDIEGKPLSMAGFPYHALDTYLPKLIRAGQRVAICDQLESPKQSKEASENQTKESDKQQEVKPSGHHR